MSLCHVNASVNSYRFFLQTRQSITMIGVSSKQTLLVTKSLYGHTKYSYINNFNFNTSCLIQMQNFTTSKFFFQNVIK